MKEDNKLINAVLDLGLEMKAMRKDMNQQLGELNHSVGKLEQRFGKMEQQQHKTNLLLAEHSRSILTLADKLKIVVDHEKRISKLDPSLFRRTPCYN
ncbi:MAG: hypothetical protein ACYDCN_07200 [Bacteroidia bacterium]